MSPATVLQHELETARLIATMRRRENRRFLAEPVLPTGFAALPEPPDYDLALAKACEPVKIEYAELDDNGEYVGKTHHFSRSDAALELKWLRARGAYIERRARRGFYVEDKA